MGVFTRFRDIVSSNLNAMLDKAEDPEKMVRLIIQEMEDTLIEVKSSCAGVMAEQKKLDRDLLRTKDFAAEWAENAKLAVTKGRDDLARAAIIEERKYIQRGESLVTQLNHAKKAVEDFQSDISELEAKLADAREKQRIIIQRRSVAYARYEAQSRIRRADTTEAFAKFEAYENNIDRMEADADLVDSFRPKSGSLRGQFDELEREEEVEQALEDLKREVGGRAGE